MVDDGGVSDIVERQIPAAAVALFAGAPGFDDYDWADPWPTYDRMRAEAPVWRNADGIYVLTRHADCEAVLRDARFSSNADHLDPPVTFPQGDPRADIGETRARALLFLDPPDHTRLRRLVSKAFTPRTVERLRPRVQQLVDQILDRAADAGGFDVVNDLGYELPVVVICELLGVPLADRAQFGDWSHDAARLLDADLEPDVLQRGLAAALNFAVYFQELFVVRRAQPGDDLVSGLLAAEEAGDRLSEDELLSMVILLFIAGHETTMNLIGNGTFALLGQADQLARWRADPSLDASGVEELLRFDGPVHLVGRIPTEDVEVGGHRFRRGVEVIPLVAAANRDPERFTDPARLDVGRVDDPHLTFSQGIHYCLGAALARLEGQVAIGTLVHRFPRLELAAVPRHRGHFVLRGLEELRVSV